MIPLKTVDEEHLDSLSVAYYIVGGIFVGVACIPLIYVTIGVALLFSEAPTPVGWMMVGFGVLGFILGQAIAIALIFSGRFLKQRKNYMFTFVLACFSCLSVPVGTILGVFTLVVLCRPSVKHLYLYPHARPSPPPPSPSASYPATPVATIPSEGNRED